MPFYPDYNDLSQYNILFDFLLSLRNSEGKPFFDEDSDELAEMLENSEQIIINLNDARSLHIYDRDSEGNENFVFNISNNDPDLEEDLEEDEKKVSELSDPNLGLRNNVDTIISVDDEGNHTIYKALENQQTEEEEQNNIIDSPNQVSQTLTPKSTEKKPRGKKISIPILKDDDEILRYYQEQFSDTAVREKDMDRVKELYALETERLKIGVGSDPELANKIRYIKDSFSRRVRQEQKRSPKNNDRNTQKQVPVNEQFDENNQDHQKLFKIYSQKYPHTSEREIENLVILKIALEKDPENDEKLKQVARLTGTFSQREVRNRKYTQPIQKSSTNESELSDAQLLEKYKYKLKGASSADIKKLRELDDLDRKKRKIDIELAENLSQLDENFNLLRTDQKYQVTPESLAVDNQTTLSSEDAALKARSKINRINNNAIPILRIIEELQDKINMLYKTKASHTGHYVNLSKDIESGRERVRLSTTTTQPQASASSSSVQSSSLTQASSSQPQQQEEEPRTMRHQTLGITAPRQQSQQQSYTSFSTGTNQIEEVQRLLQQQQTELTQLQQQLQIERMQRQLLEQQIQKEALEKRIELERAKRQRLETLSGEAQIGNSQDLEPSSPPPPLLIINPPQQWPISAPPRPQNFIAPTIFDQTDTARAQQNPPTTTHATSYDATNDRTPGSKSGHGQGQT